MSGIKLGFSFCRNKLHIGCIWRYILS
jgi:hypothetical protein